MLQIKHTNPGNGLNKMSGLDVFICSSKSERKGFFGAGTLWEEYLAGKLHCIGKEVRDKRGENCRNSAIVCPPSPAAGQSTSRFSTIVGRARTKKCVDMPTRGPVKKDCWINQYQFWVRIRTKYRKKIIHPTCIGLPPPPPKTLTFQAEWMGGA